MQEIAIAGLSVLLMSSVGLGTPASQFAAVWDRRWAMLRALLANVVAAPLLVIALLEVVPMDADKAVGLLICAASPGGATGVLFAAVAGAHLASAVTLMLSLALISVITAPAVLSLALGVAVDIDAAHLVWPMMRMLMLIQLVPLVGGMTVRRIHVGWADRLSRLFHRVASVMLLVIIVTLVALRYRTLFEVGAAVLLTSAALAMLFMALGAAASRRKGERASFALVTSVRNVALSLLLGAAHFPQPGTEAAILTFALFSMVIPYGTARLIRARVTEPAEGAPSFAADDPTRS